MPLRIQCSSGHTLIVPDDRAGRKLRCPRCQTEVVVPGEAPATAAAVAVAVASVNATDNAASLSAELPSRSAAAALPESPPSARPRHESSRAASRSVVKPKSRALPLPAAEEAATTPPEPPSSAASPPAASLAAPAEPPPIAPPPVPAKPAAAPAAPRIAQPPEPAAPPSVPRSPPEVLLKVREIISPTPEPVIPPAPTILAAPTIVVEPPFDPPAAVDDEPPLQEPEPPPDKFFAEPAEEGLFDHLAALDFAPPAAVTRTTATETHPEAARTLAVYQLAAALVATALFSVAPAVWDLVEYLRIDGSPFVARWALLLFFVGVLQLAYAVYLFQLPDWSSVWVITVFALCGAALYAAVLGIVLMSAPDGVLVGPHGLQLADKLAGGKAALWCVAMAALLVMLALAAGKLCLSWRRAERMLSAVYSG